VIIGVGLASLLGSSLRYIMLNEAPPEQRGAAQGVLTLFTSIGQLLGAAAVGAIVASYGGEAVGYNMAFRALGIFMLVLASVSLGLKAHRAELSELR
jgi:MFS family permease